MFRTIFCPYCGVSSAVNESQCGAVRSVVCEHCGGQLLLYTSRPTRTTTVLCIDDDRLVLRFYRDLLDRRGYRTLTLTDGL